MMQLVDENQCNWIIMSVSAMPFIDKLRTKIMWKRETDQTKRNSNKINLMLSVQYNKQGRAHFPQYTFRRKSYKLQK